jgi:hypothetical protein
VTLRRESHWHGFDAPSVSHAKRKLENLVAERRALHNEGVLLFLLFVVSLTLAVLSRLCPRSTGQCREMADIVRLAQPAPTRIVPHELGEPSSRLDVNPQGTRWPLCSDA